MECRTPGVSSREDSSRPLRNRLERLRTLRCVRFFHKSVSTFFAESLLKTTAVVEFLNTSNELFRINSFLQPDTSVARSRTFDGFVQVPECHRLLVVSNGIIGDLPINAFLFQVVEHLSLRSFDVVPLRLQSVIRLVINPVDLIHLVIEIFDLVLITLPTSTRFSVELLIEFLRFRFDFVRDFLDGSTDATGRF